MHFAFGNDGGRIGENTQSFHGIGFNHQVKGARKQEVAHQNRSRIAPNQIGRFFPPTQRALIHHIIMQERGRMNKFNGSREFVMINAFIAD